MIIQVKRNKFTITARQGSIMKLKDFNQIKNCFDKYVVSYYSDDSFIHRNVKLKEYHTQKVCEEALGICNTLSMNENQRLIAQTAALLHDVGRFEQITQYRTFNDKHSIDHAELGMSIIKDHQLLDHLLPEEQTEIIEAVRYHNKYKFPSTLGDLTTLYIKITRDADKIDIFRVVTENTRMNTFLKESERTKEKELEYTNELVEAVLNDTNIDSTLVKTPIDLTLLKLSWIYDINFLHSFCLIKERGYMEKLVASLPVDDVFNLIRKHVMAYVTQRAEE